MTQSQLSQLEARARAVRARVLRMAHDGRTPHVASALSCVDLLVGLYFGALRADRAAPDSNAGDLFLLSKGHGCMAQYAALVERGYWPKLCWKSMRGMEAASRSTRRLWSCPAFWRPPDLWATAFRWVRDLPWPAACAARTGAFSSS